MIKVRRFFETTSLFSVKKRLYIAFLTILFCSSQLYGQTSLKGKVTDEYNSPLIGVAISIKSTSEGTLTDAEGDFVISTRKAFPITLVVSYIGYKKQEIDVYEAKPLLIVLQDDVQALDEVVITAGGIIRSRREQGYSTTKITSKELTAAKPQSLAAGLTAKIPGLQVNAISSGVNPVYHLILRGNRSINGNNDALVVVDDAVVPSSFLNNINPEDIEDIQVLNGASGATLYGSEASNGVLLVHTKRGGSDGGKPQIKVSHSLNLESVSFYPQLQTRFGPGSTADSQLFEAHENQQFGPAFDGTIVPLGYPLENGDQQTTVYSPKSGREDFWETAIRNQTDLSISLGSDKSTSYISAQYFDATGVMPGDLYNKISLRLNNTQKFTKDLSVSYNVSFVENNYDITSAASGVQDDLQQIPAHVPITSYKDWKNNPYATPDGWFNPWYENPYWYADNNRSITKNTYLNGKIEANYKITSWLSALYRASLANRYYQNKASSQKFTFSDYSLNVVKKTNFTGSTSGASTNQYRFNQDFQLAAKYDINDFSLNLTLGYAHVNISSQSTSVSADGLVIPSLFNVGNRLNQLGGASTISHSRNYGLWGDFIVGYKRYLFLHLTGRNDWTSLLAPENRSYFYPSADLSFIPTDAFSALNNNSTVSYWKVRAALSQTGNVNIDPFALAPTYGSTTGYDNGTYFTESASLVSPNLKPEITTGYEVGTEIRLYKERVKVELTAYHTSTTGEAISASIAPSSGYTGFLLNTGEVTNDGIETSLNVTPIQTRDFDLTLGGNYTHNKNVLVELYPGVPRIGVNGSGIVFAEEGYALNQLIIVDYARDPQGRVIVDRNTGYPSQNTETVHAGNTTPEHRLGLDFSLRYKDFTLTSVFEYRGGFYYAAHNLGAGLDFAGASTRSAYYNRERFVFPNSSYEDPNNPGQYVENTSITISDGGTGFWTNSTYNRGVRTNYTYAGDYWKWRELTLTYKVPKAFLKKTVNGYVQDLSISLQGRNLFLWVPKSNEYTDPDYSANDNNALGVASLDYSPPTRFIGGTISLTF